MSTASAGRAAAAVHWLARSQVAFGLIWAAFLLPRLAVLLIDVVPQSDADWYYRTAVSLAEGDGDRNGDGSPSAFWPPGWPLALSFVFRMFGNGIEVIGALNLVCAAVTGWLLLDLARKLGAGEAAARLALLLYAIYPNAIGYVPLALTEVFYTMLLLGGVRLLVAESSWLTLVGAGLVFGCATLVKAQTLVVVPLIFGLAALAAPEWWRRLPRAVTRIALVWGIAAMVVAPWTIRNHEQLGAWVAISTNGGYTLLTGNNDSAAGGYTPDDPVVKRLEAAPLGEVERDVEARRLARDWIVDNPGRFLALVPLKAWRLWAPDGEAEWAYQDGYAGYSANVTAFRAVRLLNQLYYAMLLAGFAAFALIELRRRLRVRQWPLGWWLLPYAIAAYPTAICIVFSGQPRFHFPVMPFVALSVGWLIADLAARSGMARVRDNAVPTLYMGAR